LKNGLHHSQNPIDDKSLFSFLKKSCADNLQVETISDNPARGVFLLVSLHGALSVCVMLNLPGLLCKPPLL